MRRTLTGRTRRFMVAVVNAFIRVVQTISRLLSWFAGFAIIVMMVIIVVEVVARYGFNSTTGGSIEIGELLLALAVFASIAYGQQVGSHVSTSLLTDQLPPLVRTVVKLVGLTVVLVVVVWAVGATFERGMESFVSQEATFGIQSVPLWPGKLLLPVGLGLLAIELLITMLEVFLARHNENDGALPEKGSAHA